MSKKEVKWPDKPFFIQSKVNGDNYVLTTTDSNDTAMRRMNGSPEQMWKATADSRGSCFLENIYAGKVLKADYDSNTESPAATLAIKDPDDRDQQWRLEDLGEGSFGIVWGPDWEMRLNLYHSKFTDRVAIYKYSGGVDNERWLILTEEGQPTIVKTQYHTDKAVIHNNMEATRGVETLVDNRNGATPFTGSQALTHSIKTSTSTSTTRTDTSGEKYTQTFGFKGGRDKVFEVSASFGFEESKTRTFSIGDTKGEEDTVSETLTVAINVPAGKRYGYYVVTYYGTIDVPYTADLEFKSTVSPSLPAVKYQMEGVFRGTNAVSAEIVVMDRTVDGAHAEIERRPVTEGAGSRAAMTLQPEAELVSPAAPDTIITVVPA